MRANKGVITAAAAIAMGLGALYANEGGYVDDPADRGGKTRFGVTEAVARKAGYRGHMRDLPKHCAPGVTVCADAIYQRLYIEAPGYKPFAYIEPAVLWELLDSAALHGPPRPSRWLQQAVNGACGQSLAVDGVVGPATVSAYRTCQGIYGKALACRVVLDRMDTAQMAFFKDIVGRRPSQLRFYKGWTAHRINNVDRAACGWGEG